MKRYKHGEDKDCKSNEYMYHVCNSIGSSGVYDVGRRVVRVEDKVRGSVELKFRLKFNPLLVG